MSYDNRGKVSLWKNPQWERGSNKPYVRGKAVAHRDIREGEEIEVALWVNVSDNERAPNMTGKLSDPHQRQEQRQQPAPDKAPFNDDIPW